MFKKIFATLIVAAVAAPVFAQDNITWTEATGALTGTVGGIQMHGSAATKIGSQWYLYAIGGNRTAGGDSDKISFAPVTLNPTVTVGPFVDTTALLPRNGDNVVESSAYIERATFFYNGRLYKVGGDNNATGVLGPNRISVYDVTATGDILEENTSLSFDGAAAGVTPSLNSAGSSVVVNPATGYLYVFAGSAETSVRRFKIDQTTGAISDYQSYPGKLLHPSYFSSGAVIKGDYIYVIDSNNSADRGKVQYAKIQPDGTLGTFALAPNLPTVHIDGGSAVLNGEIYVVAGHTGAGNGAVSNKVHRSVSGPDGTITSWVEEPAIPVTGGLRRVGVASLGNDGFAVIGGRNNAVFPENVWVAKPKGSSVSDWSVY